MEQSKRGSGRHEPGGIISLARFVEEHAGAIEYDLITRTRYKLEDIGGALPWGSLHSFIQYLGTDSALAQDLGKATGWETRVQTNAILADIYDVLSAINSNLIAFASGGKKKVKPKPYPRPGRDRENTRKFGKGALPIPELREWIEERRRHHGG